MLLEVLGGGIFSDSSGGFILAFYSNFGSCTAYKAELRAVAHGLDIARTRGVNKLLIQMHNLACIQVIQSEEFQGGQCHHIINHCRYLVKKEDWEVKLVHCYREGNRAADWLANRGVEFDGNLHLLEDAPTPLGRILHEDLVGVEWPRVVHSV